MEICSYHHEEICYASHSCPLCEMSENRKEVESELKAKIESLEDQISELGE